MLHSGVQREAAGLGKEALRRERTYTELDTGKQRPLKEERRKVKALVPLQKIHSTPLLFTLHLG